jgi:dTDP-4-amino-4,6-dideoxygalactose transaminase
MGRISFDFEKKIENYLGVNNCLLVSSCTDALFLSLKSLNIGPGDEVIVPSLTWCSTVNSIIYTGATPVFCDVELDTFNVDFSDILNKITNQTKAVLVVHFGGLAVEVKNLKTLLPERISIVEDAAHAFGSVYKGKSLLDYGDIATCSFHATKVFHTIEGGAVICHDPKINQYIGLLKSFGHIGDEYFEMGINAKGSEFQAAMGLCNLADFADVQKKREAVAATYNSVLPLDKIGRPHIPADFKYNYAYYPAVFADAATRAEVTKQLNANNIFPRRYFYPSLNTLPYLRNTAPCPVSESIASRILCLPFFDALDDDTINNIARIIKAAL